MSTDTELKDAAWNELIQTTIGAANHTAAWWGKDTHWSRAKKLLDQIGAVDPTPVPVPTALFVQGYSDAEIQNLFQAGDVVKPQGYSVSFPTHDTVRFELHQGDAYIPWGDLNNGAERAQIHLPDRQRGKNNTPFDIRYSCMLDPNYQFANGYYNVMFELHHTGNDSPPITIQIHNGRYVLRQIYDPNSSLWNEYDVGPAIPGKWQNFKLSGFLSTDYTKAITHINLDANPMLTVAGKANMRTNTEIYVQYGIYRAKAPQLQIATYSPISWY